MRYIVKKLPLPTAPRSPEHPPAAPAGTPKIPECSPTRVPAGRPGATCHPLPHGTSKTPPETRCPTHHAIGGRAGDVEHAIILEHALAASVQNVCAGAITGSESLATLPATRSLGASAPSSGPQGALGHPACPGSMGLSTPPNGPDTVSPLAERPSSANAGTFAILILVQKGLKDRENIGNRDALVVSSSQGHQPFQKGPGRCVLALLCLRCRWAYYVISRGMSECPRHVVVTLGLWRAVQHQHKSRLDASDLGQCALRCPGCALKLCPLRLYCSPVDWRRGGK